MADKVCVKAGRAVRFPQSVCRGADLRAECCSIQGNDAMIQKADRVGCQDLHRSVGVDRRAFVKAGVLGTAGLSLAELLRGEARADAPASRPNNVIILWMRGGPSHIDMWDPKPDAPEEYRGEFGVIRSNVPGILLSDMLPRSARCMDKWSIIRSLHHTDAGHSSGDQI